jgi:hypothetical protein
MTKWIGSTADRGDARAHPRRCLPESHHVSRSRPSDVELAWPMLCSLMADLQRIPLDDQATLRSIFAELAATDENI